MMGTRMETSETSAHHAPYVLVFATQGVGHGEETRIIELVGGLKPEVFPFERRSKLCMFFRLLRTICGRRPDLVVMEGSGSAGGAALMLGRLLAGVPYVVSSGDAVGPYLAARLPL